MSKPFRFAAVSAAAMALFFAFATPGQAAVIPGWYTSADLSAVVSNGNSDTINVGATLNVRRMWLRTSWTTLASYTRNDVRDPQRLAIIEGTTATVNEGELVAKSEKVFANTNFERRVTERFFWNLGATAERDKFAGLNSRLTGVGGVGMLWQNTNGDGFIRVGVAGTYTAQDEVVDDPETENEFFGLRGTIDGEKRFGDQKQHVFTSNLIADENLQQTDDLRLNWQNSLAASISQKLQLKVGLTLAYDNLPALVDLPVAVALPGGGFRDAEAADIARLRSGNDITIVEGKLATPAEKLDLTFTASIVINFGPGGGASRPTP
jgi:uncharacterized protein DUF481